MKPISFPIIVLLLLVLFACMTSCHTVDRMMRPGPTAQSRNPYARPETNEFDILRLRMMERMANGPNQTR